MVWINKNWVWCQGPFYLAKGSFSIWVLLYFLWLYPSLWDLTRFRQSGSSGTVPLPWHFLEFVKACFSKWIMTPSNFLWCRSVTLYCHECNSSSRCSGTCQVPHTKVFQLQEWVKCPHVHMQLGESPWPKQGLTAMMEETDWLHWVHQISNNVFHKDHYE